MVQEGSELRERGCGRKFYDFFPFSVFVEVATPESAVCELHHSYGDGLAAWTDPSVAVWGRAVPTRSWELALHVCEHSLLCVPMARAAGRHTRLSHSALA